MKHINKNTRQNITAYLACDTTILNKSEIQKLRKDLLNSKNKYIYLNVKNDKLTVLVDGTEVWVSKEENMIFFNHYGLDLGFILNITPDTILQTKYDIHWNGRTIMAEIVSVSSETYHTGNAGTISVSDL